MYIISHLYEMCVCETERERTGCSDLWRISCSYLLVLNSHDYLFIDEGN